jgi:hypothetical protein
LGGGRLLERAAFGAPYARIDRLSPTDKIKVPDITSVRGARGIKTECNAEMEVVVTGNKRLVRRCP